MPELAMQRFHLPTADLTISCALWDHPTPRGTLQITHGLSEHIARYDYVARRFHDAGWRVIGHDHRGHGQSLLPHRPLGAMGSGRPWRAGARDLAALADHIQEQHIPESARDQHPHVLLAHSGGSFMAQQLLSERPGLFDAVILSGSNGPPPPLAAAGRLVARAERLRCGEDAPSALLQRLSFGSFNRGFEGRTEFDWLSTDPAQVDAYIEDPLCGVPISTSSWVDLLDTLPTLTLRSRLARIRKDKPILIAGGAEDPVSDKAKGLRALHALYQAAGAASTLKIYPGLRHEIVNERARDEVIDDLIAFAETAAR